MALTFPARSYAGAASAGTLTAAISSGSTTFASSTALTGWVDITGGTFSGRCVIAFGYGTAAEEKILCTYSTSTGNFTIITRGYDGTSSPAGGWPVGTTFNLVWSATEAAEAAAAVQNTVKQITAAGDILYGTGANTMTRLPIGSTGQALISNGSTPYWSSVVGAQGAQGSPGTQGANGTNGTQGAQGAQGAQGSSTGTQGTQGYQGVQGYQGYQGVAGGGGVGMFGSTSTSVTVNNSPSIILTLNVSGYTKYVINWTAYCTNASGATVAYNFSLYAGGSATGEADYQTTVNGASTTAAMTYFYNAGTTATQTINIYCTTNSSGSNQNVYDQSISVIGSN